MMLRVRRTRTPDVVESTPSRVRRVKPVESVKPPDKGRITRVRKAPETPEGTGQGKGFQRAPRPAREGDTRPLFDIDWERSLGWKLQIYLIMSYMYYVLHRTVIPDHEYDRLCVELLAGWDTLEHQHKHCLDKEQLQAGTGYAVKYPMIVFGAAEHMLKHYREI